jgi:hypothetical protein
MSTLTEAPKARKDYRCERCGGQIKAGTRYLLYRITPGSDIGNSTWLRGREHLSDGECWAETA